MGLTGHGCCGQLWVWHMICGQDLWWTIYHFIFSIDRVGIPFGFQIVASFGWKSANCCELRPFSNCCVAQKTSMAVNITLGWLPQWGYIMLRLFKSWRICQSISVKKNAHFQEHKRNIGYRLSALGKYWLNYRLNFGDPPPPSIS